MNIVIILCILGGLALGILVAFLNMLISKRSAKSSNITVIMGGNSIRLLLDAAALLIGYLVCHWTGLPMIPTLIAIAVALSVGGVLFLSKLTKQIKTETVEEKMNKFTKIDPMEDSKEESSLTGDPERGE